MTKLEKLSDGTKWDALVNNSPQANVFCTTTFLDTLAVDYELLILEDKGNIQAGTVVLLDKAGIPFRSSYFFSMYHGIIYSCYKETLRPHKRYHKNQQILKHLILEVLNVYPNISFCLHPTIKDIRPFSWYNYDGLPSQKFNLAIKYTGLIDFENYNFDKYFALIRTTRRQEYRSALKAGLTAKKSEDIDTLLVLYKKTFQRQGVSIGPDKLEVLKSIVEKFLSTGNGQLVLTYLPNKIPIAGTFFIKYGSIGYYLVGANDSNFSHAFGGTYCFLSSIKWLLKDGIKQVDVCGMNSPNRGDFKLSFNAVPRPYYTASIEQ